jgi:hypothetical protein
MSRMNWNPADFDYEPAPREVSLIHARRMLALLHGHGLEEFPLAGFGECEDECGTATELLAYCGLRLCRPCTARRNRARSLAA